jgi:thiamine-phosphate pyrophosphorylase
VTPRRPLPRIHAITDERIARRSDLNRLLAALADAGDALAVHARGHTLTGLEHYKLSLRFSGFPPLRLFINDRLDIALAAAADGVQLGGSSLPVREARQLGPNWWIGCSVHSLEAARAATVAGADYLLVGPVYHTLTHPEVPPLGVDRLEGFTRLGLPVIALGGVTPERVAETRGAGAYGVAAIRAFWDAPDATAAAKAMLAEMGDR